MNSRAIIKAFFEIGDHPTDNEFISLIDSIPNILDDYAGIEEKFYVQDVVVSGIVQNVEIVPAEANKYFIIESVSYIRMSITGSQTGAPGTNKYLTIESNGAITQNTAYATIGNVTSFFNIAQCTINDISIYPLVMQCEELPTGVTACTIKVIIKGFKIAK